MREYFPLPNPCMTGAKVYQVRDRNGAVFYEMTAGTASEAFKEARDKFGRRAKSVVIGKFEPSCLAA